MSFKYRFVEYNFVYCFGSLAYSLLEFIYKGNLHFTMVITGGVCVMTVYFLSSKNIKLKLWKRALISCTAITAIEFAVGCIVNLCLNMQVWSYSALSLNLMGQICPLFSLYWFLLCLILIPLCDVFRGELPKYMHK